MHINFRKVTLHNFMSFGHSVLSIMDDGFVRVTGQNDNPSDMAISNGSGKSSLWESIVWCITGDTIRGTKQISNLYGEDGTYVELDFDLDNKHYNLLRAKDHKQYKTCLRIIIDGKDFSGKGIRDSEKLLTEYLPDITASFLGSVIILGQGLPQKFTNNSPSGRKEVLEKLSKSDFMIEDLKDRISKRKSDLSKLIRELEDSLLSATTRKNTLLSTKKHNIDKLAGLNKSALELELVNCRGALQSVNDELNSVQKEALELQGVIFKLNDVIYEHQTHMNDELRKVGEKYDSQISDVNSRILSNQNQIQFLNKEINRLRSIKDICPTCGQVIPGIIKSDTTDLEKQLSELTVTINSDKELLNKLTQNKSSEIKQVNEYYKNLINSNQNERINATDNFSDKQNKVNDLGRRINSINNDITNISVQIAQIDSTRNIIENSLIEIDKELEEVESTLLYNNSEKDLQQSRMEVLNKFDTIVKRDFRGYLLSNIIKYIETRAQMYSKVIFETEKVGFYLDGNNIHISYMDKEYENLSGGEKQKIDLIVQFSLRDMLSNHLGFTSNILVLDEVFDGLDMIGCQKVLDVISNFNDVKNVYIVTHRKDLSIPNDRELIVVKSSNGISEIK